MSHFFSFCFRHTYSYIRQHCGRPFNVNFNRLLASLDDVHLATLNVVQYTIYNVCSVIVRYVLSSLTLLQYVLKYSLQLFDTEVVYTRLHLHFNNLEAGRRAPLSSNNVHEVLTSTSRHVTPSDVASYRRRCFMSTSLTLWTRPRVMSILSRSISVIENKREIKC